MSRRGEPASSSNKNGWSSKETIGSNGSYDGESSYSFSSPPSAYSSYMMAKPLPPLPPPPSLTSNAKITASTTSNRRHLSSSSSQPQKPIPGRPRKVLPMPAPPPDVSSKKKKKKKGFFYRFYVKWILGGKKPATSKSSASSGYNGSTNIRNGNRSNNSLSSYPSIIVAVVIWYMMGVTSIGSSKLLLTKTNDESIIDSLYDIGGVSPLFLTLQQLFIGCCFFRFLLEIQAFGLTKGLQLYSFGWPISSTSGKNKPTALVSSPTRSKISQSQGSINISGSNRISWNLLMTGVYFSLGFLVTNYCFELSTASFVETIKAAEPITSAVIAVLWGIETLSNKEVTSLLTIVLGVLISTLFSSSPPSKSTDNHTDGIRQIMVNCCIVMIANLCFSFRGLHQKLLRKKPAHLHTGSSTMGSSNTSSNANRNAKIDDINLQYRMQQIGVLMLLLPVLINDLPSICIYLYKLLTHHSHHHHSSRYYYNIFYPSGLMCRYIGLSVINGLAFASYNLASTFVLTRISVVHHATLNCLRRIFAIIVTSIMFGIPITLTSVLGIGISFLGFMFFTHYKLKRQNQPKPLSSLLPMSAV